MHAYDIIKLVEELEFTWNYKDVLGQWSADFFTANGTNYVVRFAKLSVRAGRDGFTSTDGFYTMIFGNVKEGSDDLSFVRTGESQSVPVLRTVMYIFNSFIKEARPKGLLIHPADAQLGKAYINMFRRGLGKNYRIATTVEMEPHKEGAGYAGYLRRRHIAFLRQWPLFGYPAFDFDSSAFPQLDGESDEAYEERLIIEEMVAQEEWEEGRNDYSRRRAEAERNFEFDDVDAPLVDSQAAQEQWEMELKQEKEHKQKRTLDGKEPFYFLHKNIIDDPSQIKEGYHIVLVLEPVIGGPS